jgi:hypothetical protein
MHVIGPPESGRRFVLLTIKTFFRCTIEPRFMPGMPSIAEAPPMKPLNLHDAQSRRAVSRHYQTLMKPHDAVRSGVRSHGMPGDIAGNDQAGIMRDAAGVARDS